nr:regulator of G-protein signaling 6-like [Leptinotarsa decemlineata]
MSPCASGLSSMNSVDQLRKQIFLLKLRIDRRNIKISKASESFLAYYEQYLDYDSFFVAPEYPNPWISDSTELWEQEKMAKDISARRVKRWAFSLKELLQDCVGREHFIRFLEKEFSGENLR